MIRYTYCMSRFRDFVMSTPFRLSEAEAAPAFGSDPTTPEKPGSGNEHHFQMLKGQLGMEDDDFDDAMEKQSLTIWLPQDYSKRWGFEVAGSTQATVAKRKDGNYDVTFQLGEKKRLLPQSFLYPYKKGERPISYKGPVGEKTVIMSAEELQDLVSTPFQSGTFQPPQGGMGGPMGGGMGGPPMGGGAPPMGM